MTTDQVTGRVAAKLLPAAGVSASAVLLFGLHLRPAGYVLLALSLAGGFLADRSLGRDLLLVGIGISIISTTSMAADVSWPGSSRSAPR